MQFEKNTLHIFLFTKVRKKEFLNKEGTKHIREKESGSYRETDYRKKPIADYFHCPSKRKDLDEEKKPHRDRGNVRMVQSMTNKWKQEAY